MLSPTTLKWLRGLGVEEVAVGGIPWSKVLSPVKVGFWWQPSAADAAAAGRLPSLRGASLAAAEALEDTPGAGGQTPAQLLRLAARHGMNTEVRRTVFCLVMGSEDYVDAFEKLVRLGLKVSGWGQGRWRGRTGLHSRGSGECGGCIQAGGAE